MSPGRWFEEETRVVNVSFIVKLRVRVRVRVKVKVKVKSQT